MKQHINLMAKAVLFQERESALRPFALPLTTLLLIGLMAGWYGFERHQAGRLEVRIQQLTREKQQAENRMAALNGEIQSARGLGADDTPLAQQQLRAVGERLRTRVLWSEVLREVSLLVPDGVYLTRLELTRGASPIHSADAEARGLRFVGFSGTQSFLTKFIAALERSSYFSSVSLVYAQKSSDVSGLPVTFELIGYFKAVGGEM